MRDFVLSLQLKLYFLWKRRIIKCRDCISSILFFKLYEHANSLFPDNTLKENTEIAFNVKLEILDLNRDNDSKFSNENQEELLKKVALEDDSFLEMISYFYLLVALYCSEPKSEILESVKNENLGKARKFVPDCNELSNADLKRISKLVKSESKRLKEKIKGISKNRIDQERLKLIDPITITSSHVIFVISIFSTLFLASGFAYNMFFFQYFGINVSDFFDLSDYLASSITVITSTTIATVFGGVFFFLGYEDAVSKRLHAEQFDMEIKESLIDRYMLPFIMVSSVFGVVIFFLILNEILAFYLYPLILIIAVYVIANLSFWKYINNRNSVMAFVLSLVVFSIFFVFEIYGKVNKIKNNKYESPYTLNYANKSGTYDDLSFVASNSRYLFMWDSNNNKMVVLSKDITLMFTPK